MRTSLSISNLSKALLVAQKEMEGAVKGSKNPFFKSSYADLPTVMETVKAPLNSAGIVVLQPATNRDGKNFITTTLIHAESGEFIQSDIEIVCKSSNNPQDFGAATTYARRFGLQSMLFIPAEDDDGETAMGRGRGASKAPALVNSIVVPNLTSGTVTAINTGLPQTTNTAVSGVPQNSITVKTDVPTTNLAPTVTEVAPLKASSFRKPKAKPIAAQSSTDDPWSS